VRAVDWGLNLPLVYNTSAYDSLDTLRLLDGIVDIYMPDFKYWCDESARRYLKAGDYPTVARAAIREMHRQVGPLVINADGLAQRGVLLRHLVMPDAGDDTTRILEWVRSELGPGAYVNVMGQYRPAGNVTPERYPELARTPGLPKLTDAFTTARRLGLRLDRGHDRRSSPRPLARA